MPEIVIVAGPNGAGKTSFASQYLDTDDARSYINADEIARTLVLTELPKDKADLLAARSMLTRIGELVEAGTSFTFETTLASLTYARKIPEWQQRGYVVALLCLRLPTVQDSIDRVRRRVLAGGHDIPEHIIRRRFERSLNYLSSVYRPLVYECYIFQSLEGRFELEDTWPA